MNTRTATPAIFAVSLALLLSGAASAAADIDEVHDDLAPAGSAIMIGLARGQVVMRDHFSPVRVDVSTVGAALRAPSVGSDAVSAPTPVLEAIGDVRSPLRGSR